LESDGYEQKNNATKWALIIAISNYHESTGWNKINADNDVPLITSSLNSQGFSEENILVLQDSEATKKGILDAFESHLLQNVRQGDVVYVHFSSHGQQIFDDNGDEIDGFDESVVPFDASMHFVSGQYEGQLHLRDDELGDLLTQIRQKIGREGNVLTVLDACHSGTATRGLASARGTKEVIAPPAYSPETKGSRGNELYLSSDVEKLEETLAPMVTISGASANELNYETRDSENRSVGSLSYALSLAFQDIENTTTYREMFDKIKIEMNRLAPRQSPQIEGTVEQQLWGGNILVQGSYFLPEKWIKTDQFNIKAGSLHGFTKFSVVHIYPFEVRDFDKAEPLARGTVIESSGLESTIEVKGEAAISKHNQLKVVLAERGFGNIMVRLQSRLTNLNDAMTMLLDSLAQMEFIELVEQNPDLVLINSVQNSGSSATLTLMTAQEMVLYQGNLNNPFNRLESVIANEIKKFSKARFLQNLELTSYDLNVSLELVPIKYRMDGNRPVITDSLDMIDFIGASGHYRLPVGQAFYFRIKHEGTEPAYYTIINFTSSGEAQLAVPYGTNKPGDFMIRPFHTKSLNNHLLVTTEPAGNESFKLIATKEPLDLRPILSSIRSRSETNPFQKLLEDAASTSRSKSLGVPPAAANTYTTTFIVVDN